ncbi:MAG: MraY family glycosyltransferase [Clostridiaceae bacterium]|nr:MraY family glycosyltransferase [Clostridiaceae bacterium]
MKYMIPFIITFLIVYFIIPPIMKIFIKMEFTDKPTKRKRHKMPIPLCGGFAIYIGFFLVYFNCVKENRNEQIWIFIASTMIFAIGLVDDYYKTRKKEFPIYPRFIVQILAASLVYRAGIVFNGFSNPFTGEYILLPEVIKYLLTITWIFGVTTVINWTDGMDGLSGGISLISSCTFFFAAIILGQNDSAMFSITLAGALAAFLMYNKYPARIFIGDSGANLVGFLLSVIAVDGAFKQATMLSLVIPILALAVPIFDNIFVIFKRFSEGKPVYQADRSQMHFRLEEKGLSVNQTVGLILGISFIFSTISIILLLIKH